MPKFLVSYQETYTTHPSFEIEAANQEAAIDLADQLIADSDTPPEDIQFVEWEYQHCEEIK